MEYFERVADHMLEERLEAFGAVLIEGPKWTGKTTTAEQHAKSIIKMHDPDMAAEYMTTAETKPSLLLKGEQPRLIDEWQDAPVLWDAVRTAIDNTGGKPGQYILTGSNKVDKSKVRHTGTGLISRMKMLPMSLWESRDSSGKVSIHELFDNPGLDIDGETSKLDIPSLIRVACRGGWPATLQLKEKASLMVAKDYVNTICEEDVSDIDKKQRNPKVARQILRSYARNISTLAKKTNIVADVTASGDISISQDTFDDYIRAFERLFVIQDIDAWCPSIRSKTAIRSAPKRCFVDPSIAVAAMSLSPEALETQLKTFGFIFEQMCIRDLKAYTADFNSRVSYYRDRYGLEADLVVHLEDERYALIECKLGSRDIEEGAGHLCKLQHLIREHNKNERQVQLREPDLKIILTGGQMAYTRPDGVKVLPLACLRP
ncbi:MAG: ATP-binding protein [Prevotella sp.]|jgi:predicted AAA+ superfamily ATPase